MCQRCHRGNATDRRHILLKAASATGAAAEDGSRHQGTFAFFRVALDEPLVVFKR
jgi:hypothetical protein